MDYNKAIFVFGSNEAGLHGAGAARFAYDRKGAIMRTAEGPQGQSYAIPTKDHTIANTLSLSEIQRYVDRFLAYAHIHPELEFQVTRIGCGLAGLQDDQIAPMFRNAPANCWFDTDWKPILGFEVNYWGHK